MLPAEFRNVLVDADLGTNRELVYRYLDATCGRTNLRKMR